MENKEDAIYGVECCDSDCNWQGLSNECVTFKHGGPLLCPECHEVVERANRGAIHELESLKAELKRGSHD